MEETSFQGLGYMNPARRKQITNSSASNINFQSSTKAITQPNSSNTNENDENISPELFMSQYLRECNEYHMQTNELKLKEEHCTGVASEKTPLHHHHETSLEPKNTCESNISSKKKAEHDIISNKEQSCNASTDAASSNSNNIQITSEAFQKQVTNARAIAQRLAASSTIQSHMETTPTSPHIPSEYRQKREEGQKREKQKLQNFLLKNFDYLAEKDKELHQLQLKALQQTNAQLSMAHNAAASENIRKRKNHFHNNSKVLITAGIGTEEFTNQMERAQRKHHGQFVNNNKKKKRKQDCALYVTGLPRNICNEKEKKDNLENSLKQLFGSYGRAVAQVVFYVDKQTGYQKGDGLILFHGNDSSNQSTKNKSGAKTVDDDCSGKDNVDSLFLDTVSTQVSDINYYFHSGLSYLFPYYFVCLCLCHLMIMYSNSYLL